jgi:two-component system phosphate regulon response regulator OmpR
MNPILLIEDEPGLVMTITDLLKAEGHRVESVSDGDIGLTKATKEKFALIILDVMLPKKTGFEVCRELRQAGIDTAILMLTAKTQVVDRVVGLKLGADDYLTKPFDPRELLARIHTVLRRRGPATTSAPEARKRFSFGPFELDFVTRTLQRDGARLPLRDSEFALLKIFVNHPYKVLSRVLVHDLVHRDDLAFHDRSLDVPIWRLRRVIEDDPSNPCYVQTVRGKGYVFVPDASGAALTPEAGTGTGTDV